MVLSNFIRRVRYEHLKHVSVMGRWPELEPLSIWIDHSRAFLVKQIGIGNFNKLSDVMFSCHLPQCTENNLKRGDTLLSINKETSRGSAKRLLGWLRVNERSKIVRKRGSFFKPLDCLVTSVLPELGNLFIRTRFPLIMPLVYGEYPMLLLPKDKV